MADVELLPIARHEYAEAFQWYAEQSVVAAERFTAEFEAAMRAVGKPMGTVPSAGASVGELIAAGYRFLPMTSDVGLLRDGATEALRAARALLPGNGGAVAERQGPTYG